jgi:galactose oxidase-like protein
MVAKPHGQFITAAPRRIGYNSAPFTVQTPDALNIRSVVLVKPGSDTHGYDMEQRLVGLTFTAVSGALTVNAPPNSNLAPPGYYLLFVLNHAGVPSVASLFKCHRTRPTGPQREQLPCLWVI